MREPLELGRLELPQPVAVVTRVSSQGCLRRLFECTKGHVAIDPAERLNHEPVIQRDRTGSVANEASTPAALMPNDTRQARPGSTPVDNHVRSRWEAHRRRPPTLDHNQQPKQSSGVFCAIVLLVFVSGSPWM
jgi:hypothetical protein